MSANHNRLDALRRLAKDRAATPAEKATARRFAEALAAKIGKRPRNRRKGPGVALPEPPAARWRRQCVVWLEAALRKIAVAGKWLHGVWFLSVMCMVLVFALGGDALRRQAGEFYLVRTLGLLAAALAMMAIYGLLRFVAWWLRTWRNERLRPALVFVAEYLPWLPIMAAGAAVSVLVENTLKWPSLLGNAAALAVTFGIIIPWYRSAHPVIERALLEASHGALKAGVAVVAIAVTILVAGGAWAIVLGH